MIEKEEELYYPCSENNGADQLRSYCEADLRLCFRLCRLLIFPCGVLNIIFAIIGIKHSFLYIKICWAPRVALKPEPFMTQQMLMYQKEHVLSLLLHYTTISCENLEKLSRVC